MIDWLTLAVGFLLGQLVTLWLFWLTGRKKKDD